MEFHRIKYFLEIVRWASFSKAAKSCYISQPSLSQQLKKLEDSVGGSLLIRSRDGITLTELGKRFLPYAREMMEAVNSASDFIDRSSNKISGQIKIGAIPTISPYLIPGLVKWIRNQHPKVQFDIVEDTTDDLIQKLRHGNIDLALLSPPTKIDAETDYLDLCDDELMLTLSLEHPLNNAGVLLIEDLKDEQLLLLKEAHCLSQQSKAFCKSAKSTSEVTFRSSQIDTLLGLVELGLGYTFTPQMAIPYHTSRKVSFHSVSPKALVRKVRLIWMRRNELSVTQQAVIESLKDYSFQ